MDATDLDKKALFIPIALFVRDQATTACIIELVHEL